MFDLGYEPTQSFTPRLPSVAKLHANACKGFKGQLEVDKDLNNLKNRCDFPGTEETAATSLRCNGSLLQTLLRCQDSSNTHQDFQVDAQPPNPPMDFPSLCASQRGLQRGRRRG